MKFEWDPKKASQNFQKHGVSFQEAATVFQDPLSMTYPDSDRSIGKRRYIIRCRLPSVSKPNLAMRANPEKMLVLFSLDRILWPLGIQDSSYNPKNRRS